MWGKADGTDPNLLDPTDLRPGDEGRVTEIGQRIAADYPRQIHMEWDNGSSLMLLETDPFVVVS
jgi:hypothetical protein